MEEDNYIKDEISMIKSKKLSYAFGSPFMALNYASEFINLKTQPDKFSKNHTNSTDNYTQGCKWSPDGSCFLVASENKKIQIFNLPSTVAKGEFNDERWLMEGWKEDVKPTMHIKESENIYDYQWYSRMHSDDKTSCCFAATSREIPIHLWDAGTGQIICSYLYYNHLDILVPAYSLAFNADGTKLVGGYVKEIRSYDIARPGKYSTSISSQGHGRIISTIAFHPQLNNIFAAGSYNNSIGVYSLNSRKVFAFFEGHKKGVTYLKFSHDGTKLFSGTRRDDDIICWDIRNPGTILSILKRKKTTNQRMYFDITPDDEYLLTGTTDGEVLIYNIEDALASSSTKSDEKVDPSFSFTAHGDCVNGVSVHPSCTLLLTSSGQRTSPVVTVDADSEDETRTEKIRVPENSAKLWWIGKFS